MHQEKIRRIHDRFLRDHDFRKCMLEHDRDEDVCLNWDDLAEQDFTCRMSESEYFHHRQNRWISLNKSGNTGGPLRKRSDFNQALSTLTVYTENLEDDNSDPCHTGSTIRAKIITCSPFCSEQLISDYSCSRGGGAELFFQLQLQAGSLHGIIFQFRLQPRSRYGERPKVTKTYDIIVKHTKKKTYIFSRTIMEGQRRCEGIRVELIVRGEALGFVKDELV